jgi:hypothetical protein
MLQEWEEEGGWRRKEDEEEEEGTEGEVTNGERNKDDVLALGLVEGMGM